MPERIRLNKTAIDQLEIPTKGRKYFYDLEVPNLAVCVTDKGAKTWYRCGRVNGRPQRYRIGPVELLTPQQAREECRRLNGEVAARRDPMADRRKKREEMTVQELFDWVLKHHSRPTKKTWERDQKEYDQKLSHWASRRISSLTTAEIREHHTKLTEIKGKFAANKMRELLRLMYSIAEKNGWLDHNPVNAVPRAKVQSRERFLSGEELAKWFQAVAKLQRETTRDFLLMALFSGARRSNVCAMKWSAIDFERKVWTIPGINFKNGEPQQIVLVDQAIAILERRKESSQSQWVFPGGGRTGHLVEPKAAWKRVMDKSGLKDVRFHDLRRTFGSWMAAGGSSLQMVGRALGHKSPNSTQIYSRLNVDVLREAVSSAVNAIESASKKKS